MNAALQQLEQDMAAASLDALLVTDPKHVYYLTGFASYPHERFLGLLLIRGENPVLIVPALDAEAAHAASSVKTILTHSDTDNPYALLKSRFGNVSPGSIGIEKEHFSVSRYELLAEAVAAGSYQDIGHLLRAMRAVKTPEEVRIMQHAAELVEEVLRQGLAHVKAGVSEIELVAELEYLMKKPVPPAPPSTRWCCPVRKRPSHTAYRANALFSRAICLCSTSVCMPEATLPILPAPSR